MTLPSSVQQQADLADQLLPDNPQEQGQAEVTEGVGTPAQTVQENDADDVEKLKSRYSSLKGKYDSEVPRLSDRNKELEAENQRLIDELNALREGAAKTQSENVSGLTEDDEEAYGKDIVDMVRRGARQASAEERQKIAELQSQIEQLKAQNARAASETVKMQNAEFCRRMEAALPDWQTQNSDKGFLAWLAQADPVFGFSRQALVDQAAQNYDADRVIAIFQQYRKEVGTKTATLARQVSPAHTAGSAQRPTGATVWTADSIAQFYEDSRRGRYSPEEADRIEKEIDAAVASGKVDL